MKERIYGSKKRDTTVNIDSRREFFKRDCIEWLNTLDDQSVNLIICDVPYNTIIKDLDTEHGSAFRSRYIAKASPTESDFLAGRLTSKHEVTVPWKEDRSFDEYRSWCLTWYTKAYDKLCDDSFMFLFWSMKYLGLAYEIFDVSRVIFWQQPNMITRVVGDFCYDITPILVIKKGNPKLNPSAGLWDKSSVFNFAKPQGNYVQDKLVHLCQKPKGLLEHLVWLSGADRKNNVIVDFFAGSGSLLRAVDQADVLLCDINNDYFEKFFDIYKTDDRVKYCKIIK